MSLDALHALARAAGVLVRWRDYRGQEHEVAPDTLRAVLAALDLPCASPAQCAESLAAVGTDAPAAPVTSRRRAPAVAEVGPARRPWGLTVQLYSLRRAGDAGLGDYTALADCARAAAAHGADALALSPAHAPFLADPARYSPYMPSNRLMLNPWHVDPDALTGGEPPPAELIDWPTATGVRVAQLRKRFDERAPALAQDPDFRAFRARGGRVLEDHARFEALHAHQREHGAGGDWRQWAPALRDPRSASVAAFAREHRREVDFHVFLQWLADRGLAAAQAAARASGMAIGLISDLAVGADPAGSQAWSQPQDLLQGLTLGAPPDELNTHGQDWALTTFSPRALARSHGAPLREVLRVALAHAGGVRIDHVLGLNRLWVIPAGAGPRQGAYLRCPLAALLDCVAAAAREHAAVVIGEDLGTVPAGLREELDAAGLLGLRVLWFMRDHGLFIEPSRWPASAIATTTTHDLPTVAGWWRGRDLHWRAQAGPFAGDDAAREHAARGRDRRVLWDAFLHAGVAAGEPPAADAPRRAVDAAIRFVARAPAPLTLVPLEDIAGLDEQPNLPGTIDEHPNWRRRMPAPVPALLEAPEAAARLRSIREERGGTAAGTASAATVAAKAAPTPR